MNNTMIAKMHIVLRLQSAAVKKQDMNSWLLFLMILCGHDIVEN